MATAAAARPRPATPSIGARPIGDIERFARARPMFVTIALILAAAPLLWPTIPPLVDLPNHMSRYRIGLDYGTSPYFRQWFDFHWALVGNLGVDLLATALAPLFGLELATKLVVMAIPVVTVAGMALIARETHGRVPLLAAFAFPFAYNFPLNFGFVNFALAAGLAFLAFGFWLRLGRLDRRGLRAILFVPIGLLIWLAHACGWGMLGIMVFAVELGDARTRGMNWLRAAIAAGLACLPLTVAMVPMLHWFGGNALNGEMGLVYEPVRKIALLFATLSDGHPSIDAISVLLVWLVLIAALVRKDLLFDRRLGLVAAAMLLTYLAMPAMLMGSYHSDVRIAPYAIALSLLSVRPAAATAFTRGLGIAAICFLIARTGYVAASYASLDRAWSAQLEAIDHVAPGSKLFALARVACLPNWEGDRMDHLNRMALVRRQAFTNGTWPPPGSQTLFIHPAMAAGYKGKAADNGSQMLMPPACRLDPSNTISGALASFPRDRFDYVWLIDVPPAFWPTRTWLQPIWHGPKGILYRIVSPATARRDHRPHEVARRIAAEA